MISLLVLFVTEICLPLVKGRRLFPSFRKDPLAHQKQKVTELTDTVENLTVLQLLTKKQAELEKQIAELEKKN